MLPWKSFVRSASIVTLLTAGTFAAGQDVMPFSHASRSTSPHVIFDATPAVEEEAPTVEPADEVADDVADETTTTTDAPETVTPDVPEIEADVAFPDIEAEDAAPVAVVVDAPETAKSETPRKAAPKAAAPRKQPQDDCSGKGDHNNDGHCDNGWHNKDAAWLADKANKGARPEAVPAAEKKNKNKTGDHNCDGHPDNGWHNKDRPECPTPPATADRPAPKPAKGERPQTAPGQVKKNR